MVEEVSISGLRARKVAREARVLAGIQSVVIFLLLVVVAEEYDHNEFLQARAGTHLAGLGFLLNGTLAAFYAGVLIAVHLKRPVPSAGRMGQETGGDCGWRGDAVEGIGGMVLFAR